MRSGLDHLYRWEGWDVKGVWVGCALPLADESVILRVWADPEPHDIRFVLQGKRPVVQANPDCPEAANPLEV